MGLPINVEDVLAGHSVEWERLEFKEGWNPEPILHTLCAFANDFHNLGGGYIFVGIADEDGRPILPPAGVTFGALDALQKKVVELGRKIQPSYTPQIEPYEVQGRYILVLHAPGGSNRPYTAPLSLAKEEKRRAYYIRQGSITKEVKDKDHELRELWELANNVPFDDRVCHHARVEDLKLGLIRAHLQEIGSDLYEQSEALSVLELGQCMAIVDGPPEALTPRNVGLMFFHEQPERFFPQSQIDVVLFPDGTGGDTLIEKTFRGPLGRQLRDALDYIQSTILKQKTVKQAGRAEAGRCWNYPFAAIEEILSNAVFHRSYEQRDPIEVRATPEALTIISYPGPDRSIRLEDLKRGKIDARRYRNRRIGDFLKELRLTEGRSTGIPKVLRAMHDNGSPAPDFDFDEGRTYFTAILPVHRAFAAHTGGNKGGSPLITPHVKVRLREGKTRTLLEFCRTSRDRAAIQKHLQLKDPKDMRERYLSPLLEAGRLSMTDPEHPRSRSQKYQTTTEGHKYLRSLDQLSLFEGEESL